MTDPSYTHYAVLVDRTGSMAKIAEETEAGIQQYITEQAKLNGELDGKATITLFEFDAWNEATTTVQAIRERGMTTQVNTVYDFAPIGAMLPRYRLVPRGYTPLLDAVGTTVTQTGEKLAALPEAQRPGLVIFVIVTDGIENYSSEWTRDQVKALIQQQQDTYGWRFTYLGANQDAFGEAGKMGIGRDQSMNYNASHGGTQSVWAAVARWGADTRVAGPGGQSVGYTGAERDAAEEK